MRTGDGGYVEGNDCIIGTYSNVRLCCRGQSHHIVPDTMCRISNRKDGEKGEGRIPYAPEFQDGPAICLKQQEHKIVHQSDKHIRNAVDKDKMIAISKAIPLAMKSLSGAISPACAEEIENLVREAFPGYENDDRLLNAAWRPPEGNSKVYFERFIRVYDDVTKPKPQPK